MLKEITHSLRALSRQRGLSLIAIITLALGIGANAAIFSVVNAVLLRPLSYRESDRLVMIWGNFLKLNIERLPAKVAEYADYAGQAQLFEGVAAFSNETFTLTSDQQAERINATQITANLFPLLGEQPAVGRLFAASETQTGADSVVILSNHFWRRRFAANPAILNQSITLDGRTYSVIGVMPSDFSFPPANLRASDAADVWVPLTYNLEQLAQRQGPYYLNVLARLRPHVSLERARIEMGALAQRFELEQRGYRGPNGEDGGWRISVNPLQEEIVGRSRRRLLILLGAVGLLLVIAFANVANLLLLHSAKRNRELAIRAALGASRGRIARQLLIEGLLLSLMGGILGLLLARWAIDLLITLSPTNLPRASEIGIDARVLAFTVLTAFCCGVLFNLIPAIQAGKLDLLTSLKDSAGGTASRARRRWSNLLIISEVALAIMLLIGSGLLINSFFRLQRVDPGLIADHLVAAEVDLPAARYRSSSEASSFFGELLQRVQSAPGVQSASLGTLQPLNGTARNDPFAIEGRQLDPTHLTSAGWQLVSANYFLTLGIPLLRGRDIATGDSDESAPPVAVINESMAARYWPGEDPIGRRITPGLPRPDNPWVTIVGIARDTPHQVIDSKPEPDWYVSRAINPARHRYLFVRSAGDPASIAAAIRNELAAIDSTQAVTNITTLTRVIEETIAPRKFNTIVLTVFASIALVLALIGIHSVISYSVTVRTKEIGIRMALGASRGGVMSMIVRQGIVLALIGSLIGVGGALLLSRLLSSLLFGITAADPLTYVAVTAGALLAGLAACLVPAQRATRVDPLVVLRSQ